MYAVEQFTTLLTQFFLLCCVYVFSQEKHWKDNEIELYLKEEPTGNIN
jgi:cbb3-type cytochrome oxidase subunit 3